MKTIDILGSYYTLASGMDPFGKVHCPHDLKARVAAAAKAGFTGMGFLYEDLIEVRKTYSLRDMHLILEDGGIKHIELEILRDWYRDGPARVKADHERDVLLEASAALGARHVKAADPFNDVAGPEELTEAVAGLCKKAQLQGATILFEMLPPGFSRLESLDAATRMVRDVGLPNAGLTLDKLQLDFMGVSHAEVAEKVQGITNLSVEISDGFATRPSNYLDWIINKRLMPGDGEFDLTGFLTTVRDLGYRGPIAVEVLNAYVRLLPLEVAADLAYRKARAVVDAVDWN